MIQLSLLVEDCRKENELNMEELIERAAGDLISSKYAIALTGAGMSTESGISDFRGPSGIWTKNPEAESKAYQTYEKFLADPRGYWQERLRAPSILGDLGEVKPNHGHYALAELERMGILKGIITQNIDDLHCKAGTQNILEYHGNAFKVRCTNCSSRLYADEYDLEGLEREGELPLCRNCGGLLKSDVVHFGEPIPLDVAHRSQEEAWTCDVMLICGTSAVVYPFAALPRIAREHRVERERKADIGLYMVEKVSASTIVEINAEPTPLTYENTSDYLIQGKTGEVLPKIVEKVKEVSR